jgi:dipeptidyl aminopeptidase/acylaminoacyl peptidase
LHAGDREWGAKMLTDLIDAKDWAVNQGYADSKRICIDGTSYGGYAALTAAAFTPNEFTCAIDSAGPSNLVTLMRSIPPIWESEKMMFANRIGDYVREPEFLQSRSPLFKADQIRIPMLISQGGNDIRVKQSEADQIVAAIRKNGKPVEYLLFPDEGHGLRPLDYSKFRARSESFLGKYLNGRVEPTGEDDSSDNLLH